MMTKLRVAIFTLTCLAALASNSSAQVAEMKRDDVTAAPPASASAPSVTVSANSSRVRFTALGTVKQTRLEVFDAAGNPVYSSGFLPGNVRDWSPRGAGHSLADGAYLCVVTARDVSGRVTLRQGSVMVQGGEVSLQLGDVEATAGGDAGASLSAAEAGAAMTVAAHDGADGQVTSTAGALTFRTGDLFAGADKEHVRITPEGRVGVGTSEPQATLDVAGEVRAREGIRFADGTSVNSVGGRLTQYDADGQTVPTSNVSGTGTPNQVTKWQDNAGTLVDSAITEVGGRVGIVQTNPSYRLVVGPDIGPGLVLADLTVSRGPGQGVSAFIGPSGSQGIEFGWDQTGARGYVNSPASSPFAFTQAGSERMRIHTNGFVGVGTNAPATRLDVAGEINTSVWYDIGTRRVLSVPGPLGLENTYVGLDAGRINAIGDSNTFVGRGAGTSIDFGKNNTFVGALAGRTNALGDHNTYIGQNTGPLSRGHRNTFVGREAGLNNDAGSSNVFVGQQTGINNLSGFNNTFLGNGAGSSNTNESGNTMVGGSARGDVGVSNSTAVGFHAQVTVSNAIVLGGILGTNGATADTNVGIGTTAPNARLHVARGDAAVTTQGNGLILRATDGTKCYRVTVNDAGVLSTTEVPCP